jgi:hypothetical protein
MKTSVPHWVLVAALSLAALPCAAAATAGARAPQHASIDFRPLFDTSTRFHPRQAVKLRFKATAAKSGAAVGKDQIFFYLQQGYGEAKNTPLPSKMVKPGVFEVPFRPEGPGQYAVVAYVRGARAGEIAPVRLGVVGLADGLVPVASEEDAAMHRRIHSSGLRTTR